MWQQQASSTIGRLQLVSLGFPANEVISRSRLAARAWTFQEGYLAKRRLVFTEEQVYYECAGMYSAESLDVPLAKMNGPDGQILDARFIKVQPDRKIVVFLGGVGHTALKIFGCIIDYSSRSLTYPSDLLIGFLGIVKAFETGPHRIRHLWGSSILPLGSKGSEATSRDYHAAQLLSSMS